MHVIADVRVLCDNRTFVGAFEMKSKGSFYASRAKAAVKGGARGWMADGVDVG
jgi:hypothetical protein